MLVNRLFLSLALLTIAAGADTAESAGSALEIAYARTQMTGEHFFLYKLYERQEEALESVSGQRRAPPRAVKLAESRIAFLRQYPQDTRGFLVSAYLFIPPLGFAREERVGYIHEMRKQVSKAAGHPGTSAEVARRLLVVAACHELDVQLNGTGRINLSALRIRIEALKAAFPDDSLIERFEPRITDFI